MDKNLFEYLQDHQIVDEKTVLILAYQLLKAIAFTHSRGLFHRDIKPENCMINLSTMELKLADFGSTRTENGSKPYTEYVATRWYRAPECILTSGTYGQGVDVWAVGCIIFELLTSKPLFPGKNELDQISRIHNICGSPSALTLQQFKENPNTQIPFKFPKRHPKQLRTLIPNASPEICDLIQCLITYDPRERVSADQALRHSVFNRIRLADQYYQKTHPSIPFPSYYISFVSPSESSENVSDEEISSERTQNLQYSKSEYDNHSSNNKISILPAGPLVHQSKSFLPQKAIPFHQKPILPPLTPKTSNHHVIQYKPQVPTLTKKKSEFENKNIDDTRKLAIARIAEYKKKQKKADLVHPPVQNNIANQLTLVSPSFTISNHIFKPHTLPKIKKPKIH